VALDHVELCDIKALRLSSKTWTNLGATFLFQPFVFRLDRDDFNRFKIVARIPFLLGTIHSIIFEIGSLDIYNMANNLSANFFDYDFENQLQNYGEDITLLSCPKSCRSCKTAAGIIEYAGWKCRCTRRRRNFQDVEGLEKVLRKLNKLERIYITLKPSNFESRAPPDIVGSTWS
jgi:hypothetical protein